jgi:DNA-binding transcriptional ArsR family regulator
MTEPTRRRRNLVHVDPADVELQDALDALTDPVRRSILRELAGEPDFTRACGTFDLPVSKATASHHFAVLRAAGLLEQLDKGARRLNRLRRSEFDARFPGLLALVLAEGPSTDHDRVTSGAAARS